MALTWTISFAGTPTDLDKRGATLMIEQENTRRANDLDENGDPILPPLPYATGPELKASYETVLGDIISKAHDSYTEQASRQSHTSIRDAWEAADDATQAQIRTLLGV